MTREEFLGKLPSLVKNYRPAPSVLKKINGLSLVMVIGPTGVGKTSIIDRLEINYVISDTTRSPRPEEQEGVDFYFRNDYEQIISELKNGEFVQVAVDSGGDLKATKASYYPNNGAVVMAIVSDVVPLLRKLGFKNTLSAFITPPNYEEWTRRLKIHPVTPDQLTKRLTEAKRSFKFALSDQQTHFILNDDLSEAVAQTKDLLAGKVDEKREQLARQAAQSILNGIN